jgi:NADH:quinone reductase (non-electrogenic)
MLQATLRDTAMVGRSVRDPARVWRNGYAEHVLAAEKQGETSAEEIHALLDAQCWIEASRRGDPEGGAYPAGLSLGLIDELPSVAEVISRTMIQAESIIRQRLAGMVHD